MKLLVPICLFLFCQFVSIGQDTVKITANNHTILKVDEKTMHLSSKGKGTHIGEKAGIATPDTDHWNTMVGFESGTQTSSGISNAYFGAFTGRNNNNGSGNTFIGSVAGRDNTGSNNTFIGTAAGRLSAGGFHNNFFGANAGSNNSGGHNISIGHFAGQFGNGHNNIAIGRNSLPNIENRSDLIAIGDSSLYTNGQGAFLGSQGIRNTAVGTKTLKKNQRGSNNSAFGYLASEANRLGGNNSSFGSFALNANSDGTGNSAFGTLALSNTIIGNLNTAVGSEAGRFATGSQNTFIGYKSGSDNTNGNGNVFLGYRAGENSIGSNQLMIHNSATNNPLLHGFFDSTKLVING
ncbi:MAG: hypothetical protein AAGK97_06755, partial [Bacteroidota bacterium]